MPPIDTPTPRPAFAPVERPPFEELSWKARPGNEDADLGTGIGDETIAIVGFRWSGPMQRKANGGSVWCVNGLENQVGDAGRM